MINIYDCNNWVRVQFETDPSGLALRNLFNEAYHSPEVGFYVFDGFNSRAKRRELYPDYKAQRQKGSDNFYETLKLFKELVGYTNKFKIEIPEWEADDIIAHMVKTRKPGTRIHIWSTDKDFNPLLCDEVTSSANKISNASPVDVRLYKTLVKDQSDNIKGIAGFGDKAWDSLTDQNKQAWIEFLEGRTDLFPIEALSDKSMKWVSNNIQLLRNYWTIVDFLPMTDALISANLKIGTPNLELANAKLKELFL